MNLGPVLANTAAVSSNSTVLISLSGGDGANRITVNDNVTLAQLGINPAKLSVTAKPEFPQADINAISASTSLDATTKVARITQVVDAYKTAAAAYTESGGAQLTDVVVEKVTQWLIDKHGFSKTDTGSNAKLIKTDELQCAAVPIAEGFVFSVTGSSYWGQH